VFYFIFLLCGNNRIAFVTALLFGVHPLHVESVAWVAERKDVLYSFFYLSALVFYLRYRKTSKVTYLIMVTLLFVLASLSKAMAITLPLVLLLLDFYLGKKQDCKLFLEKIPIFLLALIFGIVGFMMQQTHGAILYERTFNAAGNIINALYNLGFYLYKLAFPVNLSNIYDYPATLYGKLPLIILFFLVIGAVFYLKNRKIMFGVLFYVVVILPVLHIIPLGTGIPADRYTYLSSLGLFYLCGEGLEKLYGKANGDRLKRRVLIVVFSLIIGILFVLTWQRASVWHDSNTLWTDAINKNPESKRAVYQMSSLNIELEKYPEAIVCLTKSIEKNPDFNLAYNLRALAYIKTGEFKKARADITQIIVNNPKAKDNCARLYELCDRTEKREKKGISREESEFAEAGRNSISTGKYMEAVLYYSKALSLNPGYPEYLSNRGVSYSAAGDLAKALEDLNSAIKGQKNEIIPEYYFNRGNILRKLGRLGEAAGDYSIAIKKETGKSEYFNNRGICLSGQKKYREALADFETAIRLNPGNKNAIKNRDLLLKK
jgi:tetratricopeptide (TPR) repeat protein